MCVRAQVNTSSVALGLLDGDTFPKPYATLPGVQAQSLWVLRTIANVFSLYEILDELGCSVKDQVGRERH